MHETGAAASEDYGERAVEIAIEAERVVIQYRPAIDPTGRHWDDAMRRLDGVQPFLTDEGWQALDEPVLVIGEDTDDETHWYVAPTALRGGLVGRLQSLTVQEQAALYLSTTHRKSGMYGMVLLVLVLYGPKAWTALGLAA